MRGEATPLLRSEGRGAGGVPERGLGRVRPPEPRGGERPRARGATPRIVLPETKRDTLSQAPQPAVLTQGPEPWAWLPASVCDCRRPKDLRF